MERLVVEAVISLALLAFAWLSPRSSEQLAWTIVGALIVHWLRNGKHIYDRYRSSRKR